VRRTKADAEQTRKALLDAALRIFSQKGYLATTLDDIAREAHMTRGAIYWHFSEGKPAIFQALMSERQAPIAAAINEALVANLSPLFKLRQLMIRWLELLDEDPEYRAVMTLMLAHTDTIPNLSNGVKSKIAATRALHAGLAKIILEGKRQRLMRPDLDPHLAALAAIALLNGVALTWLLDPKAFSPQNQAAALVDTFLKGIVV
jgi:TetR/AcrR family acrAB operon transcriptional repressor